MKKTCFFFSYGKNLHFLNFKESSGNQLYYTNAIKKQFQWFPGFLFVPIFYFKTVQICTQKLIQPNHGGQSKNNCTIVSTQTDACSKNISANGKTDYREWWVNVDGKRHGITAGPRGTQIQKNWGQIKSTQPKGISECGHWRHQYHNFRFWYFFLLKIKKKTLCLFNLYLTSSI